MVAIASNAPCSPSRKHGLLRSRSFAGHTPLSTKTHTPDRRLKVSGYRYYNPDLGRWPNRDPIGEEGFRRLRCMLRQACTAPAEIMEAEWPGVYLFLENDVTDDVDIVGLNPLLKFAISCGKKLVKEKAVDGVWKWMDKVGACGHLNNVAAGFTEPPEFDFYNNLCDGVSYDLPFEPVHKNKSMAELLLDCIWGSAKGVGKKKLLKKIADPVEKALLEKMLDESVSQLEDLLDIGDAAAGFSVSAKCTDGTMKVNLTYYTSISVGGNDVKFVDEISNDFTCGGPAFPKLKDACYCCEEADGGK